MFVYCMAFTEIKVATEDVVLFLGTQMVWCFLFNNSKTFAFKSSFLKNTIKEWPEACNESSIKNFTDPEVSQGCSSLKTDV